MAGLTINRMLARFVLCLLCLSLGASSFGGGGFPAETNKLKILAFVWIYPQVPRYLKDAYRINVRNMRKEHPDLPCDIQLYFFAGSIGNYTEEDSLYHDIAQDKFQENMLKGKLLHMYKYALREKANFDYIIKMDTDVAVQWPSLCKDLSSRNASGNVYFGRSNQHFCGPHEHCPSVNCSNFNNTNGCWMYMSGGLFGISKPLMTSLLDLRGVHWNGLADLQLGRIIKKLKEDRPSEEIDIVHWDNGVHFCHQQPLGLEYINGSASIREIASTVCTKR